MDSFFHRYRNLLVLLALLLAQIIGAGRAGARAPTAGAIRSIRGDMSAWRADPGLRPDAVVAPPEQLSNWAKLGTEAVLAKLLSISEASASRNRELQKTIDRLRLEQASLLEDAKQGERLQALVDFQQKYIYKTLAAQAIGSSGSDASRVSISTRVRRRAWIATWPC